MTKKEKIPFKDWPTKKKILVILAMSLAFLLIAVIILVGSYLIYVVTQYYRIADKQDLTPTITKGKDNQTKDAKTITSSQELSIISYNIGFGAYDPDYSFFMDTGKMKDGRVITGVHSKAVSYTNCLKNTNGALGVVASYDPDFQIIQEVDTVADRSYHINQYEAFQKKFPNNDSVFANNFHTALLLYPFNEPIGTTNSGLATLSKYSMISSMRRSYPLSDSFPDKFFDLDRCFSVTRYTLSNNKELIIGNSHMSAYDKGGVIRKQQLEFLVTFLKEEQDKGNYVIVGGDFNHDIADSVGKFPSQEERPDWVASFSADELPSGYQIAADKSYTVATCRAAEMPYKKGENYEVVIDGFLCSANVNIKEVKNIDTHYLYSDHNPVLFKFSLAI